MDIPGNNWTLILMLLLPILVWTILFITAKSRISKVECIMGGITCLFALLSYSIPKTGGVHHEISTAGISVSFGIIAGIALLIIGLIEIKKFDKKACEKTVA